MKTDPKIRMYLDQLNQWRDEIVALREILIGAGLEEEIKWGKPCYTHGGENVAILQPFKASCALMFFRGTLMKDPHGVLEAPGENSQAGRRIPFTSLDQIKKAKGVVKSYIAEAIALQEAGEKVVYKKTSEPIPRELEAVFEHQPKVKTAFFALTPGRQRAYLLHFGSAKQGATRSARIEKCIPGILEGKGFNELRMISRGFLNRAARSFPLIVLPHSFIRQCFGG